MKTVRRVARERTPARRALLAGMAMLIFATVPHLAQACAVCYGDVDSGMTQGMNNGILALLAVIAAVQIGFVALFLSIRQRARQSRQQKDRLRAMQGGAG